MWGPLAHTVCVRGVAGRFLRPAEGPVMDGVGIGTADRATVRVIARVQVGSHSVPGVR